MASPYRVLLTNSDAIVLVITSSVARLPQAMLSIGIITMLLQQGSLYWLAGAIAGTFTLANAVISPQVSKLVDQYGQSKVMPIITTFSMIMLLVLVFAAYVKAPAPFLFILAMLSGSIPNITALVRARWAKLYRDNPLLHTAYSLDAVLNELSYIIGPPLAIGLSTSLFAEAGPLSAVLLLTLGMSAFLLQRRTEPEVMDSVHHQGSSTLKIPSLQIVCLIFLGMGIIGGALDVAVIAFANEQNWPASASFILAIYALGSMIVGLAFGLVRITALLERQFLVGVIITAATIILPALSSSVFTMMGAIFVAGMSFAPTMIIVMNLSTIILPPAKLTEGLTWITTGISLGIALGGAITGLIIDTYGARAGFGVAVAAGLAMVVVAMLGQPTLQTALAMKGK
ncbi:MFS transporter [Aeromonas enteropelogenes]|uniref:MFS transporter n=1 Tax=Aeromonas enteropelogenes TaxID=29489 RepID=UPI003BA17CA9